MRPLPIPNHIYSCKWQNETNPPFTNVITHIDDTKAYGYCLNDDGLGRGPDHPLDWSLSNWANPKHTIIDLGHIDTLPELFI